MEMNRQKKDNEIGGWTGTDRSKSWKTEPGWEQKEVRHVKGRREGNRQK